MNLKKDIKVFKDFVINFLKSKNPIYSEQEIHDEGMESFNKHIFIFEMPNQNLFTVKVPLHNDEHKIVYTVYGKFELPCSIGNQFNGKYNMLSCSDLKTAMQEFESMFNRAIGANSGEKPIKPESL